MKSERVKLSGPGNTYWIEGLAVVIGLLGVALILAPDRLHDLLLSWLNGFKNILGQLWVAFNLFLDKLTAANLLGFALLLVVVALIVWRLRSRLAESPHLSATACPSCGGEIRRVHRNSWDRLVGNIIGVPLRRYRCNNQSCGWQGLLRRRDHPPRESD
jgi:hypothetical protein